VCIEIENTTYRTGFKYKKHIVTPSVVTHGRIPADHR
jgi:hypothetical protein